MQVRSEAYWRILAAPGSRVERIGDIVRQSPAFHGHVRTLLGVDTPKRSSRLRAQGRQGFSCLTISTEISTAGIAPLFSSQWIVFRSSGQPRPGP
jgi:hypothetical protein